MLKYTDILPLMILLFPLLSAISSYFIFKKRAGIAAVFFSALVLVYSISAVFFIPFNTGFELDWITVGNHHFEIGLYYDALAGLMLVVVSIVALLVSIFSLEYMKHDPGQPRYFALLGLFAFSMYGIVLSSNLLLTFIFWELVGFSSYLLIGFWFEKEAPSISSLKAFLMNKIGDIGFLLGIFILFAFFKTLNIQDLITLDPVHSSIPGTLLIMMGLGLFLAAVGKSAQFPLQAWLPSAMTGPTPVSALIHAATMVAAGVYLMVRVFPLLAQEVLVVIGIVGGLTAFMGAFAAFAQNDIKKVLAYSTVSQLGYMIMAIGAGLPEAAFFHLITHAFFKAGLFLSAGSIIHYYHDTRHEADFDPQDIRNMGGLSRVLPSTFIAFTLCMLSLAGLPLFSGFLSKELILNGLMSADHLPGYVVFFGFVSVFMTAAYMARLYFKVFFNQVSAGGKYSEASMVKWPLFCLSLLSIAFIFTVNPLNPSGTWILNMLGAVQNVTEAQHSLMVPILSIGLALSGLMISYLYVQKELLKGPMRLVKSMVHGVSNNNFYLDQMYHFMIVEGSIRVARLASWWDQKVIDRGVNYIGGSQVVLAYLVSWIDLRVVDGLIHLMTRLVSFMGHRTRQVQGGNVQAYLAWAVAGVLLIFYFLN
ncbi:MAG: NADH-quinone oxidoreductase subunit L [Reichenbachiella sp.]|uniref:NADH-quinone oxidoreductase subunit 5 family protein n=1 Tax=Reichenbachiella sp. TaxID=2184521 RepID=UPI003264E2EF